MTRFGILFLIIGSLLTGSVTLSQSYDRYSIAMAHAYIGEAQRVMDEVGWQDCWTDWRPCYRAEWFLGEASWHIMIVFNVTMASRDAQGRACLLQDAHSAYDAAVRLMALGEQLRAVGGRYVWTHDVATISGWLNDPPCPAPITSAPAWGPSLATPATSVPQPADTTSSAADAAPGAERCLDDSIAFDASLTGYQSMYGAGPTYLMKGDILCLPKGYARVTMSDMTSYQCNEDFSDCEQTDYVVFTSVEVEADQTTYAHKPTGSWWVKLLYPRP